MTLLGLCQCKYNFLGISPRCHWCISEGCSPFPPISILDVLIHVPRIDLTVVRLSALDSYLFQPYALCIKHISTSKQPRRPLQAKQKTICTYFHYRSYHNLHSRPILLLSTFRHVLSDRRKVLGVPLFILSTLYRPVSTIRPARALEHREDCSCWLCLP
jgi:hypothetical protein